MIHKYYYEFLEDIQKHSDCTVYITKRFEEYLTRLNKEISNEVKFTLKRRNIKIKIVYDPSDNWEKRWNWTGV